MSLRDKLVQAKELFQAGLINEQDFAAIKRSCLHEMGLLQESKADSSSIEQDTQETVDPNDIAEWNNLENAFSIIVQNWKYGYKPFTPSEKRTKENIRIHIEEFSNYNKQIAEKKQLVEQFLMLAEYFSIQITDPPPLGTSELTTWLRVFFLQFSKETILLRQKKASEQGFALAEPPSLETDETYESLVNIQTSMKLWIEDFYKREEKHETQKLQSSLKELVHDWKFETQPYPARHDNINPKDYYESFRQYIEHIKEEIKMYGEVEKLAQFSNIDLGSPPPLGSKKMQTWIKQTFSHVSTIQIKTFQKMSKSNGLELSEAPNLQPDSPDFDLRKKQQEVMDWMNKSLKAIKKHSENLQKTLDQQSKLQENTSQTFSEEEAIEHARKTGKNVPHPSHSNVFIKPDGNLAPQKGYMWSAYWSQTVIPIPKLSFPKMKKLNEMPLVDEAIKEPGGFFFPAHLYRVQFLIDQIVKGDPGGLVVATSPYQAVGAFFRDNESNRVALSWHNVDNIVRQLFITHAALLFDFKEADGYYRPELLYYLDPIAYNIELAIHKGLVRITRITSKSMLLDSEKGGYLPYNSQTDDYEVEDYI